MFSGHAGSGWSMPHTSLLFPYTATRRMAEMLFRHETIVPLGPGLINRDFLRSVYSVVSDVLLPISCLQ